jgi:hypothetical protein
MKALVGQLSTQPAAKEGMIRNNTILVILTLLLVGAPCAVVGKPPQKADAQDPSRADSDKKPALADAVRVSTDQALADAARQKATTKDANDKTPSGDAVLELHETPPSAASPNGGALSKDTRKSPLKDIHGEAHGLAGVGANQEGGKVGGHSKDGKTSVYVETDHAGTSPSH